MFGLSFQLHISTTFPQNRRPHNWHYTEQSYGYPRVRFSLFILLLFLPSQNPAIDFMPLYTTKPISHNPARDWFPSTSNTVSPWIFSLPHSTYFPSSLFQISDFFFLLPTNWKPHIQCQTQNPPLSTPPTATKRKKKILNLKKIQPSAIDRKSVV